VRLWLIMLSVLCASVVPLPAQAPAQVVEWWAAQSAPIPGLVAWWKLDENTGTSAGDSKGAATGTLTGSPTWTNGVMNKAVRFVNGSSQYINFGNPTALNFGTGSFSISLWSYRLQNAAANLRIISKGSENNTIDTAGWACWGGNSNVSFAINPGGTRSIISTTDAITTNQWFHVVAVAERGGNMQLWINGVSNVLAAAAATPSGSVSGATNVCLANSFGLLATAGLNGAVDDVRIYNRALTQAEIARLWNGGIGTHY
jgi:hypothetical protein